MLLKDLFDPELVSKLDDYNRRRNQAMTEFKVTWKNSEFESEERQLLLSNRLSSLFAEKTLIEISPVKSALSKVLKWSSSKFNEYKKSDVIELIMRDLSRENVKYASQHFTSGSYGAGATGNGRSNYGIKGAGGDYEVIAYDLNTYIFDGNQIISFASNRDFVAKTSLSPSSIKFKNKLSAASKSFDKKWPVKDLNSDFSDDKKPLNPALSQD